MSYPKWKYKGTEGQIVQTPDDEKALGKGWTDSPGETAPEPLPEKPPAHIDDDAKVPVKKK